MEFMRFWLLHFLDWKRSTPLLRIPGSRSWLGFSFSGVRTLNCPLFLNRQMEFMRFWLLTFPRLEVLDTSPAHPWKPQLAWLFL
jgi:hypothetical protein